MAQTTRLTMAQATVRWLIQQFTEMARHAAKTYAYRQD